MDPFVGTINQSLELQRGGDRCSKLFIYLFSWLSAERIESYKFLSDSQTIDGAKAPNRVQQ